RPPAHLGPRAQALTSAPSAGTWDARGMAQATPDRAQALTRVVHGLQRVLLVISYWWHRLFGRRSQRDTIDWVVGPHEVASMVQLITRATPQAFSVLLRPNRYYSAAQYDLTLPVGLGRVRLAL